MTLVDSNVLLDLITDDSVWAMWSVAQLEAAALRGPLFINDVIYSELSVRYERIEMVDGFLDDAGLDLLPVPREALFLAGKAFSSYRKTGGIRTGVLPDFFIGAHAAVSELPLLTRDKARYQTYYPTVSLICPNI